MGAGIAIFADLWGDAAEGPTIVPNSGVVGSTDNTGVNLGCLNVLSGSVVLCDVQADGDPVLPGPEPNAIVLWSVLGGLGIAFGCCRRRLAA